MSSNEECTNAVHPVAVNHPLLLLHQISSIIRSKQQRIVFVPLEKYSDLCILQRRKPFVDFKMGTGIL